MLVFSAQFLFASTVLAKEKVTMAVGLALPPYAISDKVEGIELDYVKKVLTRAGFEVEFKFYPLARVPVAVSKKNVDGALTMLRSHFKDIPGTFYFSETYINYENYAISLKKKNMHVQSLADLKTPIIKGFQNAKAVLGTKFSEVVSLNKNYTETPRQILQNKMLSAGRIQLVVGDRRIFTYYQKQVKNTDISEFKFHDIFPKTPYKLVFTNKTIRDKVNAALKSEIAEGSLSKIEKKYLEK